MELYGKPSGVPTTAHEQARSGMRLLVRLCWRGQRAGQPLVGHPPADLSRPQYDLGTAFEAVGDLPRALDQLEILQVEGARFLDVQTRLEALRARLPKPPVPTTDGEKPRRKKKISFI
jgi:hypothetical protein